MIHTRYTPRHRRELPSFAHFFWLELRAALHPWRAAE